MRTIVDLPEDQLDALSDLCRREGISRAEAIRQAVAQYTRGKRLATHPAFGLWHDRPIDGLVYERPLRDEWERAPRSRARRRR